MISSRVAVALSLLAVCLALDGCKHRPIRQIQINYPVAVPSEYAPFKVAGTGSIVGQAFLLTRGGDSKKAAGREVTLDPLTSLSAMWWNTGNAYYVLNPQTPADETFSSARRTTIADADGRFTFSGLAPGKYLIHTVVQWIVPDCGRYYGCIDSYQGGVVGGVAEVKEAEITNVVFAQQASRINYSPIDGNTLPGEPSAADFSCYVGAVLSRGDACK